MRKLWFLMKLKELGLKEKATSFMKLKGKGFSMSEPEFLIDVMNRHGNYCTIICLVGGGQEINTGEAGLSEWLIALKNHYSNWDIYYSSLITEDDNYLSDESLKRLVKRKRQSRGRTSSFSFCSFISFGKIIKFCSRSN